MNAATVNTEVDHAAAVNSAAVETTTAPPQAATPPGYWKDPRGNLIREELIKPIDKARDALVREIVVQSRQIEATLGAFKAAVFGDIAAFVELSAEEYGAKIGGKKGNVTLFSFDGRYKVQRAIAEHVSFDERLQAAKGLIDECLDEWTSGSRPELKAIVNEAFQVDKEGKLNTGRILALKRLEIADDRWKRAMLAIAESTLVVGSKAYVRVYERVGDSDEYLPIALDVAAA